MSVASFGKLPIPFDLKSTTFTKTLLEPLTIKISNFENSFMYHYTGLCFELKQRLQRPEMVQLTSGCCQIWLSLIREKNIFKLKHLEKLKILD